MGFRKGTGFTNLNKVMTANKGNKLGSAVAGGISTQNQGVNTGIKTSQQQFQEEAQKNRLDTDEAKNKREEILGRFNQPGQLVSSTGTSSVPGSAQTAPAPTSGGTGQSAPASMQPPKPAQSTVQSPVSDQEISDFTKYRTGTYAGPAELRDAGALFSKAQQAQQSGDLTKSTGGRQELLRRFVGQGDYNQGQRQLDETLLGQDANGLRTAANQTRGATGRVQQANQNAGNLAQEYAGRAKIFGEETGKRIGEVKNPLSEQLNTEVTGAQGKETGRLDNLKSIQDMLTGTGDQYNGVDKTTRLGLGLQQAMDQGYLSQQDAGFLMGGNGKTGLVQRGQNLGLDLNSLINERLQNTAAQNVGRTGVASDQEIAKLNALDRLSGKQGTDLEFLNGQGKYGAGKTGFDFRSLEDYINRSEAEKAQSDKDYADKLAAEKGNYLNQALAYGGAGLAGADQVTNNMTSTPTGLAGLGVLGAGAGVGMAGAQTAGTMGAYGAGGAGAGEIGAGALGGAEALGPAGLAVMLGMDTLQGKSTTADTANALGNTGLAGLGATQQGSNSILEGLMKLNVGGASLANSPAGQQLAQALAYKSKLENQSIGEGSQALGEYTGGVGGLTANGLKDITSGNYQDILKNLAATSGVTTANRIAGNIGNTVGNVGSAVGNAVNNITGGGIKISDEDLKTDIDYSPKDVQGFMDRLKPASYDYKDEVKNDPRASKDRQIGVMAQDLEKSKLGKESVHNEDVGKVVDYKDLEPKMLASLAALNQRLKKIEGKE